MKKHTPGKWHCIDGKGAISVPYIRCYGDGWESALCLANLSGAYGGNQGRTQAISDLTLMAAAPDLLAACELMAVSFPHNEILRAAIAKATGGT